MSTSSHALIQEQVHATRPLAVEVENLVKSYPRASQRAVDDISFTIRQGEIFGLLGPNGAGKTTTINILTTGVAPSGGRVTIMGWDVSRNPARVKQHIAVVPQQNNLDKRLNARQILTFHASYHAVARAEREARADVLLQTLGLADHARARVNSYSGGMTQRLMLARALMHTPAILVLDEPTNSLDPQSRLFLWDQLRLLNCQGLTILLTTHDMDEAEQLCDRIAIMDKGRILVLDTLTGLQKLMPGGNRLEIGVKIPAAVAPAAPSSGSQRLDLSASLGGLPGVSHVEMLSTDPAEEIAQGQEMVTYRLYAENVEAVAVSALQVVAQAGAELRELRLAHPSLEDVFITLTGRTLRS